MQNFVDDNPGLVIRLKGIKFFSDYLQTVMRRQVQGQLPNSGEGPNSGPGPGFGTKTSKANNSFSINPGQVEFGLNLGKPALDIRSEIKFHVGVDSVF